MSQLVISNGSAQNAQSIDLSPYMDVNEGSGMDLSDPAFTNRVWSRSLLRHGATLALEQLVEKELTFPLKIGPIGGVAGAPTTLSQTLQFVQNVNMILETPGATVTWQPVGASQATTFDLLSGQLEIAYNYRAEQQRWTFGNLRLFTQPLGRTAAPRPYAAASGVGPLLMISPYASSGALAIGASTQAGVAGFGGQQQGASSGVFYSGSPSLAGDAPALLQISYVGPLPNTATNTGVVPTVAVSLLPDANYQPLITAPAITFANLTGATNRRIAQTSVASSYLQLAGAGSGTVQDLYTFSPLSTPSALSLEPTATWAGQHRLFALARASAVAPAGTINATLAPQGGALMQAGPPIQITPNNITGYDWGLYDLGTFFLRASEYPQQPVQIAAGLTINAGASAALDLAALVMLPDNATWFMNPAQIIPSQYGYPANLASSWGAGAAPWSNTLLIDDTLADQFMYSGQSQAFAPSPIGSVPSSARVTQFSRGLVPTPDPKNGLPIIAILGVGQAQDAAVPAAVTIPLSSLGPRAPVGGSDITGIGTVAWTNPGNVTAQDGAYAAASIQGTVTHYLEATNFGFAIPSGATIQGIQVQIVRGTPGWTKGNDIVNDNAVSLIKGGTVQGANRAATSQWPTSVSAQSYGSSADLWGSTWAPADINASNFGVALSAKGFSTFDPATTADVDYMAITVYYNFGTGPSFQGASQANPLNRPSYAQVNVQERVRYVLS